MTLRQLALPLLAAATATTALLAESISHHTATASRADVAAGVTSTTVASQVAVRLLHALTDDDADTAVAAITAATTPALARALLAARQHIGTPAPSPMALTVTSIATDVTGTHADVRVAGRLAKGSIDVAVAWTLRLVIDSDSRWQVEAVS